MENYINSTCTTTRNSNSYTSADGKSFQVGIDTVTPERIPLVFTGKAGKISVIFEKKERN